MTIRHWIYYSKFCFSGNLIFPLKEIKARSLKNPALEKNQILRMQRKMLTAKKERIERLIASIDAIFERRKRYGF